MTKAFVYCIVFYLLFRMLLRLFGGGVSIRVEKHYYHHNEPGTQHKPEGYTTIDTGSGNTPSGKYRDNEGEYVSYEEVK